MLSVVAMRKGIDSGRNKWDTENRKDCLNVLK